MKLDIEFIELPTCERCGEPITPLTPDEEIEVREQSMEDNIAMRSPRDYGIRTDVSI